MASIRLTSTDPGNPPVTLAQQHITKVVPRKAMRPDLASQHQHFHTIFDGSKVSLSTGETVNVREDHEVVSDLVWPPSGLKTPSATQLQSGTIAQSQVPKLMSQASFKDIDLRDKEVEDNFTEALKSEGIPVTAAENPHVVVDIPAVDETIKPAKKTPAKKVAPPATPTGGKAEEEDVE